MTRTNGGLRQGREGGSGGLGSSGHRQSWLALRRHHGDLEGRSVNREDFVADPGGRSGVSSVLDDAPVALLVADADGAVTAANPAWRALIDLDEDASIGCGWLARVDDADRLRLQAALNRVAVDAVGDEVEVAVLTGTGRRATRWILSPRRDGMGVVAAIVDLTDEFARRAELEQRAARDPLTGLVNRSEFLAFVGHALRRLNRHPGRVSVLFVDLDGFKRVNDDNGHRAGDQVLTAAAQRLRDAVRPEDVVARIGGDEFAVLCEDVGSLDPQQMTSRVRSAFAAPLEAGGVSWNIGASAGTATTDQPDTSPEVLLDAADRAMYDSKPLHRPVGPATGTRRGAADRTGNGAGAPPHAGLRVEVADRLIRDLFAVGLTLTSCASTTDEPATSRLTSAIDDLDRIIRDVRVAVFEDSGQSMSARPVTICSASSRSGTSSA